ncbi:MAG: DUF3857 domain-containing protein [Candidatus Omnitrophica bacterium]|nr:DUF3857 domain-containing protein [Candidatus Omnitrophota bacterium]MDD5592542.1 DUF3857 domain-containing protein [Candidatus Omnitrophota bacterium]
MVIGILSGCAQKDEVQQAQDYLKASENYYQRAVSLYKDLIAKDKDSARLRFELGRLYYNQGELKQAIEEFKQADYPEAKKFLAIAYYRMGNFTDALEAFAKEKSSDDEYLYYYGLTCEKLNLFDTALALYKKIQGKEFSPLAMERIDIIEKASVPRQIKDIDPEVYDILKAAPTQAEYPQAGALVLFCDERIEVTAQNTQVSTLRYLVKILNERGKEEFSESQIEYDSTYEKVELEYARIIKPDGTVVEVGSRHIRDVSKYLNFPLYSNARVYIISFPEITEGASIEYKVKILRNQLINKKDFFTVYPLQAQEPIMTAHFSIVLPKDKPLHIKTLNDKYNDFGANLKCQPQQEDGRLIYGWHFKDIPQIIPESNMPPDAQINPSVLASTFSSWQEVYAWWWKLAQETIRADSAIKSKVRELTVNCGSEEEKAKTIYNFCAQKIRYVAVEYGQAGYEPHPAADIFRNKYGDCKDQAILLVTILKEAGLSAWPVLIPTRASYALNEDFPAMFFNHCIAAVELKDKIIFMDPTAQTCPFGDLPEDDQGRAALIVKENGYQILDTPLYPASHNLKKQELMVKINSDESIAVEGAIFTYGIYDQAQRYWILYTPPELIREALKERIQSISIGATLDKYNIENVSDLNTPVVLRYSFKGPEYFTVAGENRIMPQLAHLDTTLTAKDNRKYPIDFSVLDIEEAAVEIEIPQYFSVSHMPPGVLEDSPWFKFIVEYNQKNNKIYFRQRIELKKSIVPEKEYPDFKVFFEGLAKKIKQRIVLEKG